MKWIDLKLFIQMIALMVLIIAVAVLTVSVPSTAELPQRELRFFMAGSIVMLFVLSFIEAFFKKEKPKDER